MKNNQDSRNSQLEMSKSDNKPKGFLGQMIVEIDGESDILSMEMDNYKELMDQLHPLRNAEFIDVFPFLKVFESPEVKSARVHQMETNQQKEKDKK